MDLLSRLMLFSFAHCSVLNNSMGFWWWPSIELIFSWNCHNLRQCFRGILASFSEVREFGLLIAWGQHLS